MHPPPDRGRRRLVATADRRIAGQLQLQIGQLPFDLPRSVHQLRTGGRRLVQGLLDMRDAIGRLIHGANATQHGALQPGGLALELEQRFTIFRGQARQAKRDGLERPGFTQRGQLAPDTFGQRDRVAPGSYQWTLRRVVERVGLGWRQPDRFGSRVAQVPGHAVEPRAHGSFDPLHHVAVGVRDGQQHRRLLFTILGAQLVPARVGEFSIFLRGLLLELLPGLLQRLNLLGKVIGKDRTERRVGRGEETVALERLAPQAQRRVLHVHPRLLHREEQRFLLERFLTQAAQRRIVIEDVKTATEGAQHQVVLASLNLQVAHGDDRYATFQLDPALSAVAGEEETELRPREE